MTSSGNVSVDHRQFWLEPDQAFPVRKNGSSTNGLVRSNGEATCVLTGIAMGPAAVTVSALDAEPAELDASWMWEEIVEVTLAAGDRPMSVGALMADSPETLRNVTPVPTRAWRRVRTYAIGRDTNRDLVVNEPVESYHFEIWPEDTFRDEIIHRETDATGAGYRTSAARRRERAARARASANLTPPPARE